MKDERWMRSAKTDAWRTMRGRWREFARRGFLLTCRTNSEFPLLSVRPSSICRPPAENQQQRALNNDERKGKKEKGQKRRPTTKKREGKRDKKQPRSSAGQRTKAKRKDFPYICRLVMNESCLEYPNHPSPRSQESERETQNFTRRKICPKQNLPHSHVKIDFISWQRNI